MRQPLKIHFSNTFPEAGCDEAGRGCLAGPVFAAAVMLPEMPSVELMSGLNDSKKLSVKQRNLLKGIVLEQALSYGIAMVDAATIDTINILNASILAMHKALNLLKIRPAMILVDGNRFHPYEDVMHQCIIGGDAAYLPVAAASVLAKTARDEYMAKIHHEYSHYAWDKNKGYPTKRHREAIARFGLSPYHRLSFRQLPQLLLNL
jgi:ribonuclease HII